MEATIAPDRLLRTIDVARMFQVDVKTVRRWTKTQGLPVEWLPSHQRRYRWSALQEWYRKKTKRW